MCGFEMKVHQCLFREAIVSIGRSVSFRGVSVLYQLKIEVLDAYIIAVLKHARIRLENSLPMRNSNRIHCQQEVALFLVCICRLVLSLVGRRERRALDCMLRRGTVSLGGTTSNKLANIVEKTRQFGRTHIVAFGLCEIALLFTFL